MGHLFNVVLGLLLFVFLLYVVATVLTGGKYRR